MRFLSSFVTPLLLAAGAAQAASSWGFDDAKLTVSGKKAGGSKEKDVREFDGKSPFLSKPVNFDTSDTFKLKLKTQENGKGKRAHQAFLVFREPTSGLEAPFPLTVKDSGKATVEIKQSDLPIQLAISNKPLKASLVIASFGSSEGFKKDIFDVQVTRDPIAAPIAYEKPLRYGKLQEIHHIFKDDPKSPPKIVSLVFVLAILAAIPGLFIAWAIHGANLAHLSKALNAAPVAHGVFFGSLVAMEAVFYLYYATWNLFQLLPVAGVISTVTFLSGTKALGEVQSRRLAGER
ncbi:Oligosaccharyltransferase subunit Ribophorin II-domain-containing protein [Annulohypoxylon truncatum]|uniref:Oligosaccharyltransferase subunit Ribophorin II-domain-containing protein n=1 Tax=Annulohypoxylon truncatum TaxID=327061 RepID=UPI002008D7CF|nr:Oligosaccharyltransferase subunit Ribophorin II-domain-containing protein [Annulohypoxylon truncatum]KAI1209145.1 Oligosaccharyltransferase subunit Ribophorin II-domain-containing protein [Annulohypoxylon truncatum]